MSSSIENLTFHGLPAIALKAASGASAVVSLFGAQVLSWRTPDGQERLYLSDAACFDGHTPIRGGIPLCFPQFGTQGKLPRHGFARTHDWQVRQQRHGDGFAMATFGLCDDELTHALWPNMFDAEFTVLIEGTRLDIELEVHNTNHAPFAFTAALHTYLRVKEVENCRLEGLQGHSYRDIGGDTRTRRDGRECLIVDAEVDRVYHDVKRPLVLHDSGREVRIQGDGFPDVVVWNPWEEKCAALADMPARGFRNMLCVEAAAVRNKIALDAGDSWSGRQTLLAV